MKHLKPVSILDEADRSNVSYGPSNQSVARTSFIRLKDLNSPEEVSAVCPRRNATLLRTGPPPPHPSR